MTRGVSYYYRNRHGGSSTTGSGGGSAPGSFPTINAAWSDTLADLPGANIHTAFSSSYIYRQAGPYATAIAAMQASLAYCGIRHVRDILSLNSTTQRTALNAICGSGTVDLLMTISNYKNATIPTATQMLSDLQSHYSAIQVAVEGTNEPDISGRSTWIADAFNDQTALWNSMHAAYTVCCPPLGQGSGNYYSSAGNYSGICHKSALHIYPGGLKASANLDLHITKSQAMTPNKPIWITEGGYQNAILGHDGNAPVPEDVSQVYVPIEILEAYIRGAERFYFYELGDDLADSTRAVKERNFGLFAWNTGSPNFTTGTSPTWRAKPAATALKNLLALVSDPGDAYSPAPLAAKVEGGGTDFKFALFGKRNGTYQLCMWRDVSIWNRSITTDNGGTYAAAVTPVTITVTLGSSKTVNRYRPSTSATAESTVTGTSHSVSLGSGLVVLDIA